MIATPQPSSMTIAEYLEWEPLQEPRYEYVVEISSSGSYYYPDVVITCDRQDLTARQFIRHPTLIVEVLSPGTEANDRGNKFAHYRTNPSLQEYVLIESEKIGVECYRRGEGRLWLYYPHTTGDSITFESLNVSFPIDCLYENVSLGTETGS